VAFGPTPAARSPFDVPKPKDDADPVEAIWEANRRDR
jgi:hypothetical protein